MKVQDEMSTRISVDTVSAVGSMSAFRNAITATANAWKAQETALKNSGDYTQAAKVKLDGLTQAMELQRAKIEELRSRQDGLDQSNEKQANQWLKLEKQINQANRQLASYEAQAQRAKSAYEYQASGLSDLQSKYKLNASASKAYVDRMAAEHRTASETVARYHQLASGLENLQEQYKIQSRMLEEIKNRSGETSDAYLKQKQRLDQTATSIAKTKDELKRLRVEEASLEPTGIARVDSAIIKMRDHTEQIQPKLKRLKDQVNSFWDSVKSGVMAAGIAVSAFTAYTVDGAKKAEDIQHMYVTNTNLMTTAGEKQKDVQRAINQMYADGSTLSVKYGVSQQQIAEGYQTLIKRGYDSQMALGAMPQLLQAAKASGDDFNDTMEVTTSTLEAFGMKSDNANKMMQATSYTANTLAKAADVTSTDFSKLGIGMQYAGGTAKGAGISMRDTASALGELSNNGLEASQAGTSLQRIIVRLSSGSQSATNAFKQYGLSIDDFKTKSGKLKSIPEIFDQINKKVPKADRLKVFNQAFGQSAQSAAVILSSNLKDLDAVEGKVKAAYNEDYIGKLARRNMKSAKSAQDRFKYASQAIQIEIGQALLPAISKASVALAEAFSKKSTKQAFADLAKDLGKLAMAVVKFAVYCSKHKTMVVGFAKAIAVAFVFTKAMSGLNALIKGIGLFARVLKVATLGFNPWMIAIEVALALIIKYHKQIGKFDKDFGKAFKGLGTLISKRTKETNKEIGNWWNSTKKSFADGWKDLKKKTGEGADNVKRGWDELSSNTVRSAQQMFNKHKSTFQAGYKVIQDQTTTWHDFVSGRWDRLGEDTKNTAQDIFKFNRKIFSDMYNKLNDMTGGRLGDMLKIWQDIFGKIRDAVGNAIGSVHRHFVDLVNGVLKPFKTMIDDVKGGINWVLDKVGGSKIGGNFSISMPSYANGTNDTHPGGFARVNDGLTAHYREMFMTKDGQVGMFPANRNLILPLPKGTSVLDGERSYQLSRMLGTIPHYADGVGNAFSSLLSKVGDATDDVLGMVDKIMSKPVEFMESVFQKFVHVSTPVKFAAELVKDVPVYITKQMGNWIKKQFETLANPGGAGVERWRPYIIKAFKELGVAPADWKVAKLLRQIQTESRGNPLAFQHGYTDRNSGGNEARGLLQFAGSTWRTDALPGHTDWRNGYDEILAAIHVLEHGGEGGWGNVGNGHGWANGGLISNHGVYEIAEKNMPEYVIPTDISRRSRAYQLLGEIVARFRNDDPTLSHNAQYVDGNDRQSDALIHKLDELLSKFDILLRLSGDQVDAIKAQGSLDMQQLYKKEAKDARMRQLGF